MPFSNLIPDTVVNTDLPKDIMEKQIQELSEQLASLKDSMNLMMIRKFLPDTEGSPIDTGGEPFTYPNPDSSTVYNLSDPNDDYDEDYIDVRRISLSVKIGNFAKMSFKHLTELLSDEQCVGRVFLKHTYQYRHSNDQCHIKGVVVYRSTLSAVLLVEEFDVDMFGEPSKSKQIFINVSR